MRVFIQEVLIQEMADAAEERRNREETQDWVTPARLEVERLRREHKDLKGAVRSLRSEVMEVIKAIGTE